MRKKTTRKDEMLKDNQFGRLLESLQVRQGWRQEDAAAHLGFSLRTYSDWVTGKNLPFSEQLQHIAATFKLDPAAKAELYLAAAQSAPKIHNLPFPRNPLFTGREGYLKLVADYFKANTAVTLSGLPGIGKTQLALEYAHRCYQDGVYQAVFRVDAANEATLASSYDKLAHKLKLPDLDERDLGKSVDAVKEWLEIHTHWLLIMDNADDLQLARDFFPRAQQASEHQGRILLTTRWQMAGDVTARKIDIDKMASEEGLLFLLLRSKVLKDKTKLDTVAADVREAAAQVVELLDGHPLALDQAGAYIEDNPFVSFTEYIHLYSAKRSELLRERGSLDDENDGKFSYHPATVVVTFELCFEMAQKRQPMATDILRFCAFLHPDAIPEELFQHDDGFKLDAEAFKKGIRALRRYSLIKPNLQEHTYSIHRLVQAVLIDAMYPAPDLQKQWRERVLQALNAALPVKVEFKNWRQCERLLPHVLICADWMEDDLTPTFGVAKLFHTEGIYLYERGRYSAAEALLAGALFIYMKQLGAEHPATVRSLHNLAVLYSSQGKYEQAERLYHQSLAIQEKYLGTDHPETAKSLYMLALLYHEQDIYGQAESFYRRALRIWEKHLGAEHPDIAYPLHGLAMLLHQQGQHERAEALYQHAISILEQQLGSTHPHIQEAKSAYANFLYRMGQDAEAAALEGISHEPSV